MAASLVQSKIGGSATAASSLTVTLDAEATAGNLLVVFYSPDKASGTITKPTGFEDAVQQHTTGADISGALFYAIAEGGETEFTASHAGGTRNVVMAVYEYSGVDTLDQSGLAETNSALAKTVTVGPTASAAPGLALAFWACDSASSIGTFADPTDDFEALAQRDDLGASTSWPGLQVASKVLTEAGMVETTLGYTGGSDEALLAIVATFKASATVGAGVGDWLALSRRRRSSRRYPQ